MSQWSLRLGKCLEPSVLYLVVDARCFKEISFSLERRRVCCCSHRSLLDGAYMDIHNVVMSQSTHMLLMLLFTSKFVGRSLHEHT